MAFGRAPLRGLAQSQHLSVLSPQSPDPRPPGVDNFALDLLDGWRNDHDTGVDYETHPFFALDAAMRAALDSGQYGHDVLYNWAAIPDEAHNLAEIGSRLSTELVDDLPSAQAASVSWQDKQYGLVSSLSLMVLFYNRDLFEAAGISEPPATWDDLKALDSVFGGDFSNGVLLPYGASAGIGGVASIWMAFLQQAGGRMYDDIGTPVFDDASGVDALQFMIDLLPITANQSLMSPSYGEVALRMTYNDAAMTCSFPAFWNVLNGNAPSGEGKIVPAVMPKGPENNATINGVDAWTIAATSPNQELAVQLIEFYLSPEVQKRQFSDTGWLPSRRSVLADPDIQTANPVAAIVLDQADSPFDSFVTPNYMAITDLIGREIQKALRLEQSAAQALRSAKSSIQPLITW